MENTNEITLTSQGRLLKVKTCGGGNLQVGGGARSRITVFSRSSRMRLLQKMATLKTGKLTGVFLTLTYGQEFPHPRTAKRHLDTFIKRLRRQHENVSGFWRLEFQRRGAPHFHLILFSLPFIPKEELANDWAEIVGMEFWDTSVSPTRAPFTRIEMIHSHSHASRYVAKYVAKADGVDGGFNVASYLTAEGEFIHPVTGLREGSIGRWWGVINAEALPFADLIEIGVSGIGRMALDTLRRALAALYWRIDPDNRYGFFLFIDDPDTWASYFEEMVVIS